MTKKVTELNLFFQIIYWWIKRILKIKREFNFAADFIQNPSNPSNYFPEKISSQDIERDIEF